MHWCRWLSLTAHQPVKSPTPQQALPEEARNSSDPFAVAAALGAHCRAAGYGEVPCARVELLAAGSINGNFGKRPGAVCAELGACRLGQACGAASPLDTAVSGTVDACSGSGLANGMAVRANGAPR